MKTTDIQDLIPQVLSDQIITEIETKYDFMNDDLLTVYDKAEIRPGRSLDLPVRSRIGLMQDKEEGESMAYDSFTSSKITITPQVKALKFNYTMEAGGGYLGDLGADIVNDLSLSAIRTIDKMRFETLQTVDSSNDFDRSTKTINYEDLVELFSLEAYERPNDFVFFVSNKQLKQLKTMKDDNGNYILLQANNGQVLKDGVVGYIDGIEVRVARSIVPNDGVFENFLVEKGAIAWVPVKDFTVKLEEDNDKLVYWVYSHFVAGTALQPNKTVRRVIFAENA